MSTRSFVAKAAGILAFAAFFAAGIVCAQENHETDPSAALSAALAAACRANEIQFANYLTADNAAAFRALPAEQRTAFLKRLSLADEPAKPLISSDAQNHTVFRCAAPEGTAEFRFGEARTRENLSFVPVTVVDGAQTDFGLVRENRGWRLISLGLVLLDIPQLSRQWAEGDLTVREDSARAALASLAVAIQTYRRAYGKLPESLAQLGPAPKNEISPEQASLVSEHLAAGAESGYRFSYRPVPTADGTGAFEIAAMPDSYGKSGRRSFLMDSTGRVHAADKQGEPATVEDPLVQ